MTTRTLEQMEAEERQLRNRLIELEVEIDPEKRPMNAGYELNLVLSWRGERLCELENEKQTIGLKLRGYVARGTVNSKQ